MNSLEERLVQLMVAKAPEARRFKELERVTGITANRWQSVWHKRQRPMPDMIEAAALAWPEHALWLTTGCTDNRNGHSSPSGDSTFDAAFESRPHAVDFLRLQAKLRQLSSASKRSWSDRWKDWLTAEQEKNREKYPWLVSVHPELAQRKVENTRRAKERDDQMQELIEMVNLALKKRDAEARAIYGDKED